MTFNIDPQLWEKIRQNFAALEQAAKAIQGAVPDVIPLLDAITKNQITEALKVIDKQQEQITKAMNELNKQFDALRKQFEQLVKILEQRGT